MFRTAPLLAIRSVVWITISACCSPDLIIVKVTRSRPADDVALATMERSKGFDEGRNKDTQVIDPLLSKPASEFQVSDG